MRMKSFAYNRICRGLLLLLLDAARRRQHALELEVRRMPRHLVREQDRFHLDAVHCDAAAAGVGMHVVLIVGLGIELRPVAELPVDRDSLFL